MSDNKQLRYYDEADIKKIANSCRLIGGEDVQLTVAEMGDYLEEAYNAGSLPSGEYVQSDWNESAETSDAFIKNKPPIKNGEGKNSVILSGGENQAIGNNSVAFGSNNIAGRKCYYIDTIDITNNCIYLNTNPNTKDTPTLGTGKIDTSFNIPSLQYDYIYYNEATGELDEENGEETEVHILNVYTYSSYTDEIYLGYTHLHTLYAISAQNNKLTILPTSTWIDYYKRDDGSYIDYELFYCVTARSDEDGSFLGNGSCSVCDYAEGFNTYAAGSCSHAEGFYTTATGGCSHAEGVGTKALEYAQHAQGMYNIADNTTSDCVHIVGYGSSEYERANIHQLTTKGRGWFAQGTTTTNADYAEYFEWEDGNLNNEDRVGYLVTLDGEKIRLANTGDEILGIISGTVAVLGDDPASSWKYKYLTDDFGRIIYEDKEAFTERVVKKTDKETGEVREETEKVSLGFHKYPVINPEYDSTQQYIPRSDRPEWDTVGILGKLYVRDDGTATVNGYVTASENGIATASSEKTNMRVLSRINDNVIRVFRF